MKSFESRLDEFKNNGIQLIKDSISIWETDKINNDCNRKLIETLSELLKRVITMNSDISDLNVSPYKDLQNDIDNINDTAGCMINGAMLLAYIGKYLSMYNFNIVTIMSVLNNDLQSRKSEKSKSKDKQPDKREWSVKDYERHTDVLSEDELRALTEVKTISSEDYDEFFN